MQNLLKKKDLQANVMGNGLKSEKENQSMLDQIILGIAHELNNPNAFIRLNSMNLKKMFWMLRPCLDEYDNNHPESKFGPYSLSELRSKMNQQIESIIDATVRIIVIADKLKQCTSDSLEQSSVVSILDIITDIIRNHKFLLDRSTKINFSFEENNPYQIEGYRLQMEQALSILFTNACDAIVERHGDEGEQKGRFDLTLSEKDEKIILSAIDNGCGMSPETLEKAFVPYFSTKPQGSGDGLGLPICRSIITRHEGTINIKSKENQGTEITIELPKKVEG